MGSKFIVVSACIDDAPSISQLSDELGYPSETEEVSKRLQLILEDAGQCAFIAKENENLVGWIHGFRTMRLESDEFVEIGGLIVSEQQRKNGVGKSLVSTVTAWAKDLGIKSIRVRCQVRRKEAHLFYERLGFENIKTQEIFTKSL